MRMLRDERGVVTIETALILMLFVLPVAMTVASWAPTVEAWVAETASNLKLNSELQKENNELLHQLLQRSSNGVSVG